MENGAGVESHRAGQRPTTSVGHETRSHRADWAVLLPGVGLVVGVITSYAQGWLDTPWSSLANSASPWLAAAWAVGWFQRSSVTAAALAAATCVAEVAGYYAASAFRGFGISTSFVAFWAVCGLVGGPVFGLSAHWARASAYLPKASLGLAAIPATFLGEAVGGYWWRLGYDDVAILFAAVGLVTLTVALARSSSRWSTLVATLMGAAAASVVYGPALGILG